MSAKFTIGELKKIVAPIARKYGVESVYLFGSFARGDNTDTSDIDIRVEKGDLKGYFALSGLYSDISEALGMKVDLLPTGSLDNEFLSRTKNDEVLLYERQ